MTPETIARGLSPAQVERVAAIVIEHCAKAAEARAAYYRRINGTYLAVLGKEIQDAITEDRAAVSFGIAGDIRNLLGPSMNGDVLREALKGLE